MDTSRPETEKFEPFYRDMFENANDVIYTIDSKGAFTSINKAGELLTGYSRAELLQKNLRDFIPLDYLPLFEGMILGFQTEGERVPIRFDLPIMTRDGQRVTLENSSRVSTWQGETSIQVIARDVTERKNLQEKLDYLAFNDALTGLPNRILFQDRVNQALSRAQRYGNMLAFVVLDLDRFKQINDVLGHDAGDRLLFTVARRLASQMRAVDTVARVGGDEFHILFSDLNDENGAEVAARRIYSIFSTAITVGDNDLYVTPSIGISLFPKNGNEPETLLKKADIAMYAAKALGKNNYQFYTSDLDEIRPETQSLEKHLRKALEKGEFQLHYQPQVDLRTKKINGMEALLRWQHPQMGLIPPLRFISLAEELGLIAPIGEWVMRTACAQNKAWQEEGLPPVRVAINLSVRQFHHPGKNLVETVRRILDETGLEPRYLELEITEGIAMKKLQETVLMLKQLHELGVSIAIDDFGTGYSSLAYLKKFPIDALKIDRVFIADLIRGAENAAIVNAILAMAHGLKIKVIAEGVEEKTQLDFLQAQGCDEVQGFYFSHPLTATDFRNLLSNQARNLSPQ